jgi:hypothetical protein
MRSSILILVVSAVLGAQPPQRLSELKVDPGGRFLVTADGKPFFYLGDTAWELFHRLNREEATRYLENRSSKGFTVIQAVALAELDGLNDPNPYGYRPLLDNDPLKPDVKDGADNDYWDHVDFIVKKANSMGLYVGFLPTWGDKWNGRGKVKEIFTPENARTYGEWIGKRYKDAGLIWILGGDRPIENETQRGVLRAMAEGLRAGDGGKHLITLHPNGGGGSAESFHAEEWLSFNMRQNGHAVEYTGRYDKTLVDYQRMPVKPVVDGEPVYEDHPVAFRPDELGHTIAADVRRPLYWDLFNGACGHTYGHLSVWQMYSEARKPINRPLLTWAQALDQPGAGQMQYGRKLIESRPYLTRIPDPDVIVDAAVKSAVPGTGRYHFAATREENGAFAMVYAPVGRRFSVRMDKVAGPKVVAWWFNPRNGQASRIGIFENNGTREFTPPESGEMLDWVLVLDSAAKNFPAPGAKR